MAPTKAGSTPGGTTKDAAAWPVQGLIRHFRHEIEDRITQYRAPRALVSGATVAAE